MTPHSLAGSWNEFRQQFENCLGAAKAEKAFAPAKSAIQQRRNLGTKTNKMQTNRNTGELEHYVASIKAIMVCMLWCYNNKLNVLNALIVLISVVWVGNGKWTALI